MSIDQQLDTGWRMYIARVSNFAFLASIYVRSCATDGLQALWMGLPFSSRRSRYNQMKAICTTVLHGFGIRILGIAAVSAAAAREMPHDLVRAAAVCFPASFSINAWLQLIAGRVSHSSSSRVRNFSTAVGSSRSCTFCGWFCLKRTVPRVCSG